MRALALLAGAVALVSAAPQAARDWRATGSVSAAGGVVTGNPAAKVKLVEYLSFTCPHCADFAAQSKPVLHDGWVRGGSVQVEVRAAVRDPYDLAAWVVARCGGPQRFAALSSAIFAAQDDWTQKGGTWVNANLAQVKALPQIKQMRVVADQSGLSAIGARHGVTPAALTACLANDTIVKSLVASTEAAFAKIHGTPAFEVNGVLDADTHDWAGLEPKLRAAGAR